MKSLLASVAVITAIASTQANADFPPWEEESPAPICEELYHLGWDNLWPLDKVHYIVTCRGLGWP